MNLYLAFLLSVNYDSTPFHPDHQADWDKSGLTEETRIAHKVRTVPPDMLGRTLLDVDLPDSVESGYLIPFPDPRGGWMDHVRMRIFPEIREARGAEVTEQRTRTGGGYNKGITKYFVRRLSPPRLYFPIPTMARVLDSDEPVWLVEGCKKALAVMQLGLPAVGFESPFSWHLKDSRALLDDFAAIRLRDRIVELLPDGDVRTNQSIRRGMREFADALRAVGARPRLVRLPKTVPA